MKKHLRQWAFLLGFSALGVIGWSQMGNTPTPSGPNEEKKAKVASKPKPRPILQPHDYHPLAITKPFAGKAAPYDRVVKERYMEMGELRKTAAIQDFKMAISKAEKFIVAEEELYKSLSNRLDRANATFDALQEDSRFQLSEAALIEELLDEANYKHYELGLALKSAKVSLEKIRNTPMPVDRQD